MICGFKKHFVPKIHAGIKKHTMRKGTRWKVGMSIQMATGVRTKNYNCFKEAVCKHIQSVEIKWKTVDKGTVGECKAVQVFIDGRNVTNDSQTIDMLVACDGFDSRKEFFEWFNESETYQLIHWTDLEY
jgi:hypothetical protein